MMYIDTYSELKVSTNKLYSALFIIKALSYLPYARTSFIPTCRYVILIKSRIFIILIKSSQTLAYQE